MNNYKHMTNEDILRCASETGVKVQLLEDGSFCWLYEPTLKMSGVEVMGFVEQRKDFQANYGKNWKSTVWSRIGDFLRLW